jgi:hypothetical protein
VMFWVIKCGHEEINCNCLLLTNSYYLLFVCGVVSVNIYFLKLSLYNNDIILLVVDFVFYCGYLGLSLFDLASQ